MISCPLTRNRRKGLGGLTVMGGLYPRGIVIYRLNLRGERDVNVVQMPKMSLNSIVKKN